MAENPEKIVIAECGSQYTQLIKRAFQKTLRVSTTVIPVEQLAETISSKPPRGIILSGSSASVYSANPPRVPYELILSDIPTLGICYGMQWMANHFRGTVSAVPEHAQYGPASFAWRGEDFLLGGLPRTFRVWMSHADSVTKIYRPEMHDIGHAEGVIVAVKAAHKPWWGLQFHPEVEHTDYGMPIFENFLRFCKITPDLIASDPLDELREKAAKTIPPEATVLIAYSGGVDSSVAAAIIKSLGRNVILLTIDAGNFREGELEEIKKHAGILQCAHNVVSVDFFSTLSCLRDPEKKRKAFRHLYWKTLDAWARYLRADILVQGSLESDKKESGRAGGAVIKSHHNFREPQQNENEHDAPQLFDLLEDLYKDEVRAIGRDLCLPASITEREPFPGPGLFVRVGEVTPERVATLRWADARVREILRAENKDHEYDQTVVSLGPMVTGVMGDQRSFGHSIVIRAVKTKMFMTAEGIYLEEPLFRKIEKTLVGKHGIMAIQCCASHKPLATIEPE